MSVSVVGSAEDLGLASGEAGGDLVVLLGDAPAPDGAEPERCVRLAAQGDERLVATAGSGLWRRAPWPAADDLLSAPAPAAGAPVLVIGAGRLADALGARGVPTEHAERLDRERLLAASAVLFGGSPGEPLPAHAPAVLAAGRVLIVPRTEPGFGLLPAIDHLAYEDDVAAAQVADAAFTYPDAFESIRAMGRIAVRPHLASTVYARWAADVDLGI